MYTFLVFILFTVASCASNRPVATTHTERIEERVMPIPVGADTIEITLCRDTRSECPDGTRSVNQRSLSQRRTNGHARREVKNSVSSVGSVREKENSVRIKSTRGVNISRHKTDTTSTLRITLRPDTVFVPYMTHIRSDTIVAPCPTTQAKLTTARWQIFALILILIAIIIFILKDRMTKRHNL